MRIIQLIDSLQPGGAERMAVNYANALASSIEFSGLIATRREGALKSDIAQRVHYMFLNRKNTLDISALLILRKFCIVNAVRIVHAHGTSFFFAFLLKLIYPKIRLIWHDHNGDRVNQTKSNKLLAISASWFSGIIAVNNNLKAWAQQELKCNNVIYLPNFASVGPHSQSETRLLGDDGYRILLLANLRHPKNHHFAVEVAARLHAENPNWTYHFVGKDYTDAYSKSLKNLIVEHNLADKVFVYGLRSDISNILSQADICILTSSYEGLPVALIEYGMNYKSVVVTAVGEMPNIIQNDINGYSVDVDDVTLFCERLQLFMQNAKERIRQGEALFKTIESSYSEKRVIEKYLQWLQQVYR
jgi:glycosyltransferase involved in cell wall biosynthesis